MKTIATVNTVLPTVEGPIEYFSGESLRDYDIALFDPGYPYQERVQFSGGGSCLTIESTQQTQAAMTHWASEMRGALKVGKTVFVLLNEFEDDLGASGTTLGARNARTYQTFHLNNYQALPITVRVKNTKGRRVSAVDGTYRGLLNSLSNVMGYKVIIESGAGHSIFSTKDGATVGSVVKVDDLPGHLVLLPHFDLNEDDKTTGTTWSKKALGLSTKITAQLIAIDKALTEQTAGTPPPDWIENASMPLAVAASDAAVRAMDANIAKLTARKERELDAKRRVLEFSRLLYESGKLLESAIEQSLQTLGFAVENYRAGDLEIDHIIVSPNGTRMIGESEGKDTSAIDISKFRQLESNINEDFQRDEVKEPAKGVLFGNGFRFTDPSARDEQFTAKCLTNAKRLKTALVRTSDLYEAVVYALDNPGDEVFKNACRTAIENSSGDIVIFPKPQPPTTPLGAQVPGTPET